MSKNKLRAKRLKRKKHEDAFIAAHYTDDENFTLQMNNVGPHEVMNLIGHLAVLLETKENISIEETAARLIADQGNFTQELQESSN